MCNEDTDGTRMDYQRASSFQPPEDVLRPQATGLQFQEVPFYASFPGDRRWNPGVLKQRRRSLRLKVQVLLTVLLPLLFLNCSRNVWVSGLFQDAGRRLAGDGSESEEEQQAAIVNICLALEEDLGLVHQIPLPLPPPQEALPRMLDFLLADLPQQLSPESVASEETSQAPAPPEPTETEPPLSPQIGPYEQEAIFQWLYEAFEDKSQRTGDAATATTGDILPSQQLEAPQVVMGQKRGTSDSPTVDPMISVKRMKAEKQVPVPSSFKKHHSGWKKGSRTQPSHTIESPWQQSAAEMEAERTGLLLSSAQQRADEQGAQPEGAGAASDASRSSTEHFTSEGSSPVAGPSRSPASVPQPVGQGDGAFTQRLSPRPSPVPRMPPSTHLYYRTPELEPEVQLPWFDVEKAFSEPPITVKVYPCLLEARQLLAKEKLDISDAANLMHTAGSLVKCLLFTIQGRVERAPQKAVRVLGLRYLLMDALLSVVSVLGPFMRAEQWWSSLAERISSAYYPDDSFNISDKSFMVKGICERLSAALNLMKKGIRPCVSETLWLKKALFGSGLVDEFQLAKWNPWKEDDPDREGTGTL